MTPFTITVAQLNDYVAGRLRQDPFLRDVWVEGEISKPSLKRGMGFFALADDQASVNCVVFRDQMEGLEDLLEDGRRVRVQGETSLFPRTGQYRITVQRIEPAGVGELFLRLMEVQKRLAEKGYFGLERKRTLPPYPRRIAVVTSKEGAALQDILQVAGRRNPGVAIQVFPTLVQGDRAPASIVNAIQYANAVSGADILIVARGGGSAADLAAFNDERVVTAVAESGIPVVSAVGHETDISLCDMAADKRAPTPSAAAEIAVPDRGRMREQLEVLRGSLQTAVSRLLERRRVQLRAESQALRSLVVTHKLDQARDQLRFFTQSGLARLRHLADRRGGELRTLKTQLEALNPRRILQSGYAVVLRDGRRVLSASELKGGDKVELLFADGTWEARILEEDTHGG